VSVPQPQRVRRRLVGRNVWLGRDADDKEIIASLPVPQLSYEVLDSEESIGRAMFHEIKEAAFADNGDLVIVLLGGRGAQALHRLLGQVAKRGTEDKLLGRLHVFTQDALAPMRMNNGFSFVRDFEHLLGKEFFQKVKSFTPMRTDGADLEKELTLYVEKLMSLGGIDIFFLGLGPELGGASHLAYIKPGSGATPVDFAGVIPISSSILEHHISKFKVGESKASESDEEECREASHILTLGPAAILGAKRIVQSILDASTAPAKRESYRRLLETKIAAEPTQRAAQLNENPGLWLRLHPNVRSLILADVLAH